jgi:hypothetical protein
MSQPQLNTEHIKFRIGLSGTYWDKKPQYVISLNDELVSEGYITSASNDVQYIEFTHTLVEEQSYKLQIRFANKTDSDVVQNEDCTEILKDMLLNIVSIEIDDIDIENLRFSASEYVPDDPKWPAITDCVNLGWTGTYILRFSSPFYLWLLENM